MKSIAGFTSFAAALALGALTMACGGKDEPPPNSAYNGQQQPPNGGIPGADPTTTPPAGTGTAPTGTQPAAGGVTGTAQVIDANTAAVASGALATEASKNAPGAVAEGPLMAGSFQTAQNLEQIITMQPGKCYTVIGSSVGIPEFMITAAAVSPLPGLAAQFGEAKSVASLAGSVGVLGPKDKCLKLALIPIPVQAKITITATKGAGLLAAQVYVK